MVRVAAARWLIATLGFGGLALAQDRLIVDPWNRVSALFEPAEPTPAMPVGVASFPVEGRAKAPAVVPLGPPLVDAPRDPWAAMPVGPGSSDNLVDPWATAPAVVASHEPRRRSASDWARQIREIVDPWSNGPLAVRMDPLIVDPWAR